MDEVGQRNEIKRSAILERVKQSVGAVTTAWKAWRSHVAATAVYLTHSPLRERGRETVMGRTGQLRERGRETIMGSYTRSATIIVRRRVYDSSEKEVVGGGGVQTLHSCGPSFVR